MHLMRVSESQNSMCESEEEIEFVPLTQRGRRLNTINFNEFSFAFRRLGVVSFLRTHAHTRIPAFSMDD